MYAEDVFAVRCVEAALQFVEAPPQRAQDIVAGILIADASRAQHDGEYSDDPRVYRSARERALLLRLRASNIQRDGLR